MKTNHILECEICKGELILSTRYDTWYCKKCNKWNEPICDDPKCIYCKDRPKKPSQAEALV